MAMLDKYCAKSEETTMPVLKRLFQVSLWCIALSIGSAANAQTWPARPIKLIVPTGPGAATDIMARLIAESVSRTLGRPMFVENMPGASGILAHETAARAAPDGYTLLFTNTSGMAINPISFKHLPYNPTRDFAAVALACSLGPQMLSVNADLPVSSVSELIAYAKANRGKLSIAFDNTAGSTSPTTATRSSSTTRPAPRRLPQSCSTNRRTSDWSRCRIVRRHKRPRMSPVASIK